MKKDMDDAFYRDAVATRPTAARRFLLAFVTLRGRLILLICFATVPALLFIFFVATRERDSVLERMETEARHLGGLASREHAHQLEGARNLLARLEEPLACDGHPACPDYLSPLLAGFPQFANIVVLATDGTLLCSGVGPQYTVDSMVANPTWERALRSDRAEVGSYTVSPIVGRPVLHVARAIRGADRAACKVAMVAIDLRWLDQLARQANLPHGHALLITDRDGRVLAGSGEYASFAREEPSAIRDLAEVIRLNRGVVLDTGKPPVPRLLVATPMKGIPDIFAVVGLPYEHVQGAASRAFYRTMIGLLVLTVFTVAVAILSAEISVLRVLRALSRSARLLGAGDLSVRAPLPRSHGELRDLTVSFNTMADALAARHREATEAQNQLRALSQRLQLTRDTEAARIARELHDELGQVLTSLTIDLTRLQKVCSPTNPAACARALAEGASAMVTRVEGAIEFVRRLSSELRPPVLDRLGIGPALQWLANGFEERTGLAVLLDVRNVDDIEEPCDDLVSTTLFRTAQEALTNVVRHAAATEVTIDLAGENDRLVLTIHDNGVGIDPEMTEGQQSLGILGMRERAHLAGGKCTITGVKGQGTTVVVEIPRRSSHVTTNGAAHAHSAG